MKRFVREAQVVASLHHPNIVQVHDFLTFPPESGNTTAYMVMDYVQGQTLNDYIRNTSRLGNFPPASEIIHLFGGISSAIDYAHQRGMIHRDIKPANILLDQRNPSRYQMGMPILTDFGIVKLLGASTSTLTGWWLGTPLYISPEQAQGLPGNERSDIYSLGVILYEICTGVRPFQGDSPVSIIMQHLNTLPTPPNLINPRITPALADVITRGLAKDPAARFPSASSMAAALADALNMSTPANLNSSVPTGSGISGPTSSNSAEADLPASMTPSSPAFTLPTIDSSSVPTPIAPLSEFEQREAPLHIASSSESTPTTPVRGISGPYSIANTGQKLPDTVPSKLPPKLSALPPSPPRRKGPFVTSIALLILILIGSSLGAFYLLSQRGSPATGIPQIVGRISFTNSGLFSGSGSQGIDDGLQIDLHNIPVPTFGKSYYGWLLTDNQPNQANLCAPPTSMPSISLGPLSLDYGNIRFHYPGDQQHTNLIGIISGLLITEESATITPGHPSTDKHSWRYYAELPQTPDSTSQPPTSALDHLRCLLARNIDLQTLGIQVGLEIQFFRNAKSVWEWAISAKDSSNPDFIHSQVVRILDYLDGSIHVKQDVPPSTPLLVDNTAAQIPLLDLVYGQDPSSFLIRMHTQLNAISRARDPNLTSEMRMLANQADQGLSNVGTWLEQVRQYAKQLVKLTRAELLLASSSLILSEMENEANYAYSGQVNSGTNEVQLGVLQIHATIQRLAIFNVTAYPSQ
jgi:serine/threonine protein kinase